MPEKTKQIVIDADLHQKIRIRAAELGVNIKGFTEKALREALERTGEPGTSTPPTSVTIHAPDVEEEDSDW